jgi:glutamine synthetase
MLKASLTEALGIEDVAAQAKAYFENVLVGMNTVCAKAESLEKLISKESWPLPGYEELLFKS